MASVWTTRAIDLPLKPRSPLRIGEDRQDFSQYAVIYLRIIAASLLVRTLAHNRQSGLFHFGCFPGVYAVSSRKSYMEKPIDTTSSSERTRKRATHAILMLHHPERQAIARESLIAIAVSLVCGSGSGSGQRCGAGRVPWGGQRGRRGWAAVASDGGVARGMIARARE